MSMRKAAAVLFISLQLLQHVEAQPQPKGGPKAKPKVAKASGRRLKAAKGAGQRRLQAADCVGTYTDVVMPNEQGMPEGTLGGAGGVAGTLNDCISLCVQEPTCKSFVRESSATDDASSTCYFKINWDTTNTVAFVGWNSFTVSTCQAMVCSATHADQVITGGDMFVGDDGNAIAVVTDQYTCNSICLATGCQSISWPTPSPASSPAPCYVKTASWDTGPLQALPDYTGIEVSWTGCASTDCTAPSPVTTGYIIGASAAASGTMTLGAFVAPASGLSCNAALGYTGTASATTCTAGAAYTLTGCTATDCIAPSPVTTGYLIGTLVGGTMTQASFVAPTSGLSCNAALDYDGTASATACGSVGGPYTLTGCTKVGGDLTAQATAGATVLQVSGATQALFSIGDQILIGYGLSSQESNTVASFGSINLATPLANTHASGATVVLNNAASAVGDPVTYYRGKKIKFWLPNFHLKPLLYTPSFQLYASTFPGERCDLQWFERFVVSEANGQPIVTVKIRKNIHSNQTSGLFEQLDIHFRYDKKPLRALERLQYGDRDKDEIFQDWALNEGLVRLRIGRRSHNPPRIDAKFYEFVYVETPDCAFLISPAHAAVEFPDDRVKALAYSHLDLFILDMRAENRFTGILPQLWGVVPLTEEVEAMTAPPASDSCAAEPKSAESLLLPPLTILQSV